MSGLAQEIMDKIPADFGMVPMKAVVVNPSRLQLAGSSDGNIAEGFDVIHTTAGVQTVVGFYTSVSGTARLI